jgi:hypothetical protein
MPNSLASEGLEVSTAMTASITSRVLAGFATFSFLYMPGSTYRLVLR